MISQRAKQATYLFGLVDAMLLVLALFLAFGLRSLVTLPLLRDGLTIDLGTHMWLLTVGIPVIESLSCEQEIGWCEEVGVTVHLRADLVRTLFARMYPTDLDGTGRPCSRSRRHRVSRWRCSSSASPTSPVRQRRLSMKPEITCFWQVSSRNGIDFDDWMRLDLAYIDTWSLRLDVQILLRTVPVVLTARGAH